MLSIRVETYKITELKEGIGGMRKLKTILAVMAMILIASMPVNASQEVYIVKSGDSLWTIARQHNMLVSEIKELNHLASDMLHIGDRLILSVDNSSYSPQDSSSSGEAQSVSGGDYYIVKAGDCLWSIANAHNMTVEKLRSINNLTSDNLFPGDRLLINGNAHAVVVNNEPVEEEFVQEEYTEEEVQNEEATYTAPSRSGSTIIAASILQEAAKYLGTPYKYGGSGPGGFDCSGFVQYIFGQQGYSLGRTAADQASQGIHVDKSDLKPGDLVFFICGGSGINHAGIYTGNGQFIHSSSPRSGGVIYSSLTEGYYLNTYAGARRVLR